MNKKLQLLTYLVVLGILSPVVLSLKEGDCEGKVLETPKNAFQSKDGTKEKYTSYVSSLYVFCSVYSNCKEIRRITGWKNKIRSQIDRGRVQKILQNIKIKGESIRKTLIIIILLNEIYI